MNEITDTFPYPQGSVIGVLSTVEDAQQRLEASGLDFEVLHGEPGLARIDAGGEEHGRSGTIVRRLQALFGDEGEDVQRYEQTLRDGRYVVGVKVGEDEDAKGRAAAALHAAHAESLRFYADRYVEDL